MSAPKPKAPTAASKGAESTKKGVKPAGQDPVVETSAKTGAQAASEGLAAVDLTAPAALESVRNHVWTHYPDPFELHFGAVDAKAVHIDFDARHKAAGGFDDNIRWARPDLDKKGEALAEELEDIASDLDSLSIALKVQGVELPENLIEASADDPLIDADGLDALRASLKAVERQDGPVVKQALELVERLDRAQASIKALEEKRSERDNEGSFPSSYLNYVWPLNDDADDLAEKLAEAEENGFSVCGEIIEVDGDAFLLVTGGGMDMSEYIANAHAALGYLPPASIASTFMSSWGRQNADSAVKRDDPASLERQLGVYLACARSLDCMGSRYLGDRNGAAHEVQKVCTAMGLQLPEDLAVAGRYPRIDYDKATSAMEQALADLKEGKAERAQATLQAVLSDAKSRY